MSQQKMEGVQGEGELERPEKPSPLTDAEKQLIQQSWEKVSNRDTVGVTVLLRFFKDFPSSKKFFRDFKDLEPKELEESVRFKRHAGRVMNAINTLVHNLGDSDVISSTLKVLSSSHADKHRVDPVYFKILHGVILKVLAENFPDVFTAEVGAGWTKLLATVYFNVTAMYADLGWPKLSTSSG
ncbi:cytoglobin-1-like [Neosynchiropus ocellatus]